MKLDPGKAFPHPVLRGGGVSSDYPKAEFQVSINLARIEGTTRLYLKAEFELSDNDLKQLVTERKAAYVLLIKAPKTHFRQRLQSWEEKLTEEFEAGRIAGRTEILPFLVCAEDLVDFRASGWNKAYGGRRFDIEAGSVLAQDEQKDYWIDRADEAPIGSIFEIGGTKDVEEGCWRCELDSERVVIRMSGADYERFEAARSRLDGTVEAEYLMSGLYLPVLIHVLHQADRANGEYLERRWFASLNARLQKLGLRQLGADNEDRSLDAQSLLEKPFDRLLSVTSDEQERRV